MNCGITPADIASCYTGMGGLHGLKRSDYDNYSQYGRAKREIDMSQHFTPYSLAEWIVDAIRPRETDLVADLTCGHGVFFNYMPVERNIYGNELDLKAFKVAKYLYPEANLINEDIRFYNPGVFMDIIVGNPPYSLRIGDMDSVAYYCKKAAELLKPAGLLVVIAPKSYMADEFSNRSEIEMMNKNFNFITQLLLKPYAFAATGVDNFETKIMFFQRRSEHLPEIPYRLDDYCLEPDSEDVYQKLIRPVMEQKDKIKQKLYLEQMAKHDNAFQSQVTKLLFDIGQHPRTKPQLAECMEYVTQFNTQKRPDGVRADDWEEMMIKPEDVIKHLKDVLASQNPKAKKPDKRLVYTQYAIKEINGASVTEQPVYRLVKDDTYPFIDQT
jgi:predicted RNA methylase